MQNQSKIHGDAIGGHPQLGAAYRIKDDITIVVLEGSREKFQGLKNGSILIPVSPRDSAGMIEAKHEGTLVRVFQRDLDQASERFLVDTATDWTARAPRLHG